MIKINCEHALGFLNREPDFNSAKAALDTLLTGSGVGSDFLGWVDLPFNYDKDEFNAIKACANEIRENADILVVVGVGGSYLGARAAIEFLRQPQLRELKGGYPRIAFTGNGLNSEEMHLLIELLRGKSVYVNVISKSGTTFEPAIAFRLLRNYMEETYGKEEAARRIICTTDKEKGTLKNLADVEGYRTFVVPDDIGGRYSVLTPVGLLPIAASGMDIDAIMQGAKDCAEQCKKNSLDNPALIYAATRQAIYNDLDKKIEILSCPAETTRFLSEWWKQLFAESEGKDGRGILPASCIYTKDLHSLGQYIQDGERIMFETWLLFENPLTNLVVAATDDNVDGLNYIAGKSLFDIYDCAKKGALEAHVTGGVPCIEISAKDQSAHSLGELFYFFEMACGISGYMQGINPFDQPGVEEYKKNMFRLLGK